MAHLFVLFPILIILAVLSHNYWRRHPETQGFRYYRNLFGLWSVCTSFNGIIAVAAIQAPWKPLFGLAIGVPFYYFAMASLILLPFAMYKKMGILSKLLSALVVLVGISIGISNYFVKVVGDAAAAGISLAPVMELFAGLDYRAWTTAIFIVPVGLFFLYEATRARTGLAIASMIIIAIGLIGAGIAEPQHILAKHTVIADFGTTAAFAIMLVGLLLPVMFKPREVGAPYQTPRPV